MESLASECELLAPAGDFTTALAAFEAGADAVYCGLTEFSARAFANNFSADDLKNLIRFARAGRRPRRVYVTFNTVIDEGDLEDALGQLALLDEIGPDGLIVQDLGVARLCRRHFPRLALHASTQLVAHNLEGVLALRELGFSRVVLARELSLGEIASIATRCGDMELEVFIHGALCYSLSGLCLFGAMEKGRSGNRGKCPYCCREGREVVRAGEGGEFHTCYPFSMKDLRLGEDVRKLVDAGVASLKIEGRMKSTLYVASVTRYYRGILDRDGETGMKERGSAVTVSDLETVFSRRTTELYFNGRPAVSASDDPSSPIDPGSLGHLGAPVGVVKKVAKDREGLCWLRFHTSRGLEKHDGLQFEAMTDEGRHLGMAVAEMRQAISRRPVFEVNAGVDVEVLVTEEMAKVLRPGMKIYCSLSNAVKRMFPTPGFRESDYPGILPLDVSLTIASGRVTVAENALGDASAVSVAGDFSPAKNPEKTREAAEKAFSKLGGTDYRLGRLVLDDPGKLFVPVSVLNELRRQFVGKVDECRMALRRAKIAAALEETCVPVASDTGRMLRTVKVRAGQKVPAGAWDEIVVAINRDTDASAVRPLAAAAVRLALPVYTAEPDFNRLRTTVKRFLRDGFDRWEAGDLATLRMLVRLGVTDVTADWTLYAFNSQALAALAELGVKRFVASPENGGENLRYLAESGYPVEFLVQQSTPLFVSLTEPAARPTDLAVYRRDGLFVTTRPVPRTFEAPSGASARHDLSWDPEP